MTTSISTISRSILLTLCCLPLVAADCDSDLESHRGAWVTNQDDHVALLDFKKDGSLTMALEQYDANPLFDGMKLEMQAVCKPKSNELDEQGRYILLCSDVRVTRATQGIAVLFDTASLIEAYARDNFNEKDPESSTMEFELSVKGDRLTLFNKATDKKPASEHLYDKVPSHKVGPFLERFREDTVELQFPASNRRERDLP